MSSQIDNPVDDLRSRIGLVQEKIYEAAVRAGRDPGEIELIAVTKSVDARMIELAGQAGIKTVGENRAQDLLAKRPLVAAPLRWHFIGTLQRNKVRSLIGRVELIHSLDRISLAEEISAQSTAAGVSTAVLVQVNLSGETTKQGLAREQVLPFLEKVSALPGLCIKGLMTIAPLGPPAGAREVFQAARQLAEQVKREKLPGVEMAHLSMGMTNDYETAVEEGSTMVRIGTAIFGPRSKPAKE
ncbi:MAG: YggS family pyridoxal phosphate-dependent enzyme [Firmicutes bacterium]|nr:YggS family pyridoxal phosphate-dependent enzyme [Bacillota bacterium]